MPKVFVPQTPSRRVQGKWVTKYDLSSAEEHGTLVHLTDPGMITQGSMTRVINQLREKLRDYGPEDSIMAVGDPAVIGIAVHYAAQSHRTAGEVHLLRFDRIAKRYKRLAIQL